MNICGKTLASLPELIGGHLYKHDNAIYIYDRQGNVLINVSDGCRWSHDSGYGKLFPNEFWEDVTDKYCLKEI